MTSAAVLFQGMISKENAELCCFVTQKQLLSRFLYPNPVCLLSVADIQREPSHRNVMTVSWLMPVDNQGNIMLSLNATRCTATILTGLPVGSPFVLNVPTVEQQELVLQVGKCSGHNGDKFTNLDIDTCFPGWRDRVPVEEIVPIKHGGSLSKKQKQHHALNLLTSQSCAISCCVAHLVCTLVQSTKAGDLGFLDSNHILISANISCAYVKAEYWNGTNFISRSDDKRTPPIMCFLGSGVFANITSTQPSSLGSSLSCDADVCKEMLRKCCCEGGVCEKCGVRARVHCDVDADANANANANASDDVAHCNSTTSRTSSNFCDANQNKTSHCGNI